MANLKSTAWSRKHLLPALIMFTMCYNVIYNVILFRAVQEDANQDSCSALPGVGNADSPHCQEVRLFRTWHEADESVGLLQSAAGASEAEPDAEAVNEAVQHSSMITVVVSNHTHHLGEALEEDASVVEARRQREVLMQERHDLFDALEKKVRASLNTTDHITPWAHDLMTLQTHLETEMHEHDAVRHRKAAMDSLEKAVQTSLDTDSETHWSKDLTALRNHLENESEHLHASAEARHAKHVAMRANITNEIAERMTNLETHLEHLASERKEWEGKLLNKYGIVAATTPAPKSFLEKRLQWSSVLAWSKTSWRAKPSWSASMSALSKHDVRHMHWSGVIPRVACVTAIHGSRHTKARMMYFINNFRLQDYEGARQLVLVYHVLDAGATALVLKYADGSYIKGVAVHGDRQHDLPSSSSLRYGAWSADTDVVARWDFEEWHDPSRLSMQVRALAMASRPACIFRSHPLDSKPAEVDHVPDASSLIGEKSWMDQHWHPLIEGERKVLETSQAAHVVELDMQNARLETDIEHIKESFGESAKDRVAPEKKDDHAQQVHKWNTSACLEFDNSWDTKADHSNNLVDEDNGPRLEKTIGENVGKDMGKSFHKLMARHHDITQKLQLLCLQSTLEHDAKKRVFMWKHVDQMAGIRAELDKHITSMTATFASS